MDEEATRVPPASPVTKSKGGDKRRLSESPRSVTSGEKVVPHYLRASTGSCHDFCKHGKPEGYVSDTKDSRPWRSPVSSIGRDSLCVKESGGTKKTVVVKPKPSADPKIHSSGEDTMDQEVSNASENIDTHAKKASSDRTESKTSYGPETTSLSEKILNQEISLASENVIVTAADASLDTKDSSVSKKSSTLSKVKPPSRSPSPIPLGSSVRRSIDGRNSVEGSSTLPKAKPSSRLPSPTPLGSSVRRSIDKKNNVEGLSTLSKAKPPSRSPSPIPLGSSIRRSIDGRKSVEGRTSLDERKALEERKSMDGRKSVEVKKTIDGKKGIDESVSTILEATQRCDGDVPNSESNSEASLSVDGKKGSEGSNSLNLESNEKDDTLGDAKIDGKSEVSKKHVAAPKPRTLKMKPQTSLIPTISKSPSSFLPSSGAHIRTSNDSASRLDEKKIGTITAISPSSRPSANGEEISNMKKVRVVRIVSSVRRPSKIVRVAAKVPNDQTLQEEDIAPADTIKIAPEKKSLASVERKVASSKSLIHPAPLVSKSTVRARISHSPSPKITEKDASILRKSKGVDLKSDNQSTLKERRGPLVGETAQLNRRSVKIRVNTGSTALEKNNSDSFLFRRPSVRRKKNGQVLFNKVIEETANRLVRTSKSKVLALVGAFETVISIQKKSSAPPKVKRISSKRKPSR